MFMTKFGLLIIMCLSIDIPNKECINVPFINKVAIMNFYCFFIFKKIILDSFDYLCLPILATLPTYCNN